MPTRGPDSTSIRNVFMGARVFDTFADVVECRLSGRMPSAASEIGASGETLRSIRAFARARWIASRLPLDKLTDQLEWIDRIAGNFNTRELPDGTFGCVADCFAIAHDQCLWKSFAETEGIVKKGERFIVRSTLCVTPPTDKVHTTLAYVGLGPIGNSDSQRFGTQAVRGALMVTEKSGRQSSCVASPPLRTLSQR